MRRRDFIPLALAAGCARGEEEPFTIESPVAYKVYQRDINPTVAISVWASTKLTDCDEFRFRQNGGQWTPGSGNTDLNNAQHLSAWISARPGPHVVEVGLLRKGEMFARKEVHFGVGEVFVVAGQSNATNYGEELQSPKSAMVTAFDGAVWRIANDPQPGVQDNSSKGSFIPAFGDALSEKVGAAVGVACVGHGSTSVRQWLPGGERFRSQPTMTRFVSEVEPGTWQSDGKLFDGLVERLKQLGPAGFRAVLWHQGESDAHQGPGHQLGGADYREMLATLLGESRLQAGWDVPWFVAQASYHTDKDQGDPEIRAAQAAIWKSGLAFEGPDTDRLGPAYRQNNGTGVHMNAKGLRAHGELWAEKVAAYIKGLSGR